MYTICAWCKKVLKDCDNKELVSHGICKECVNRIENKIG